MKMANMLKEGAKMTDNETLLQNRLVDLKERCEKGGHYTSTAFLTLAEQDVFFKTFPMLNEDEFTLWGGFPEAERKVLRFGSEKTLWYEEEFPICCVEITPTAKKFAEKLSHRDVLGAIMNLGIERNLLGDIIVKEDVYYVICLTRISEYITEELKKIRHTTVRCGISEKMPEGAMPDVQILNPVVSSLRADGIVSKVFHLSRNESEALFSRGLVFVNGRETIKGSILLKDGDLVSVRGNGKFRFSGTSHVTGKGNYSITIEKYI